MAERCKHGMDARFCAACRATSASPGSRVSLDEVLAFLDTEKIRATYSAVAAVVGVDSRTLAAFLQHRGPEASWVVAADTGLPTGHATHELQPDLVSRAEILGTATQLQLRIALWKHRPKR